MKLEPIHVYVPILGADTVDPDNVTSPGIKPDVHALREATHFRPVDASHSSVPQAQSIEFASLPSNVVQAAIFEHVLRDNEQNLPVDVVQSVVPQAQSFEFSTLPSVLEHASIASVLAVLEHLFNDD